MSHEIIPVDPTDVFLDMDPNSPTSQFTRCFPLQEQYVWDWDPYDSERLPETLASAIQKFLRVANLVESEEPRVAYLCRFHTFEEAHRIDCTSSGRGVRQFKSSLLKRLEKDHESTMRKREETNDTQELKRVYHAYKEYIIKHIPSFNLDDSKREKLINAHEIASVLYEILKKLDKSGAYASTLESIQLNQDEETGNELLDKVILLEKKIGEIDLKLKDVEFWTSMMQNLFPDQVPPSMKAKTKPKTQA